MIRLLCSSEASNATLSATIWWPMTIWTISGCMRTLWTRLERRTTSMSCQMKPLSSISARMRSTGSHTRSCSCQRSAMEVHSASIESQLSSARFTHRRRALLPLRDSTTLVSSAYSKCQVGPWCLPSSGRSLPTST